jgi:hypothetical protein
MAEEESDDGVDEDEGDCGPSKQRRRMEARQDANSEWCFS